MSRNDAIHEQARLLAAEAIDSELTPRDAEWLASHLESCQECREAADEFRSVHEELRSLPVPIPPRNLWAKTAAGLDEVDRARTRRAFGLPRLGVSPSILGSAIAVGVVVVLVGVSVVGQPVAPGPGQSQGGIAGASKAPQPPGVEPTVGPESIAVAVNGNTVLVLDPRSGLITARTTTCGDTGTGCTVEDTGQTLGKVTTDGIQGVALDNGGHQAVVWSDNSVQIVPVTTSTVVASPSPTATATTAPTSTTTPGVIGTVTPKTTPTATPIVTPSAPTATPSITPAPTIAPSPSVSPVPTPVTAPISVLDGFTPVSDPVFSPDGLSVAFAAKRVDGSTGPDVFVWHVGDRAAREVTTSHAASFSGWFGQDQILVSQLLPADQAFPNPSASQGPGGSASPSPSVTPSTSPSPIATQSFSPGLPSAPPPQPNLVAVSYLLNPFTCDAEQFDRPMLDPAIDLLHGRLVYWAGSVGLDEGGKAVVTSGDLYFDLMSNIKLEPANVCPADSVPSPAPSSSASPIASQEPSLSASPELTKKPGRTPEPTISPSIGPDQSSTPEPSALPTLPQRLPVADPGSLTGEWKASWDVIGQHVAVWVATDATGDQGQLSVFAVDVDSDRLSTDTALLSVLALREFQITADSVVFTAPAAIGDGKPHVWQWPILPTQPSSSPSPLPTNASPNSSERPGH